MVLAVSTEPPQGLGISPNRHSSSGTALKRVHAIRKGLRVRGALATSTRKPEGTPISADGPSVFGKDTGVQCDSCPGVKPVPTRGFSLNNPQRLQDFKKI